MLESLLCNVTQDHAQYDGHNIELVEYVSSYVAYNMGKMFSKERDQFGDGAREGVACCEAATRPKAAMRNFS